MLNDTYKEILSAINQAFIDSNNESYSSMIPSLIYNDDEQKQKVITALKNELFNADEFFFSVAFITKGGLQLFKEVFKELKEKGIKGKILTSDYLYFTEPSALKDLRDNFNNIEVKMYKSYINEGFHTKGYLIKQKDVFKLFIGSSNITDKALTINKEWNTKLVSTKDGELIKQVKEQFFKLWNKSTPLDEYLDDYEKLYNKNKEKTKKFSEEEIDDNIVEPNKMQLNFINCLELSIKNKYKRGLLISATGTGKTYACFFGLRNCGAKRILFIAHRTELLLQAYKSFKKIFPANFKCFYYSGESKAFKNLNIPEYNPKDIVDNSIVFATSELLGKDAKLNEINKFSFDFIVIDEVHKAGSKTYQKILDHFNNNPKFILGMTATPERTDDPTKIYEMFDHNVIFEIRLNDALDDDLLCPFHYYGITDLKGINDETYKLKDFKLLFSKERVDYIVEQCKFYGFSGDRLRGLIFCSTIDETKELSKELNNRGYKTISLCAQNTVSEREEGIKKLKETDISKDYLDYILTVDLFNEGIDIPEINQIVMLRPTKSSIIFIQQLGRGLRKWQFKDFVVILDFIGNYDNNFMIPLAFEQTTDKDNCKMLVTSNFLPGISTIEFDRIAREKIFSSIEKAKFSSIKILVDNFLSLYGELGRVPTYSDFLNKTTFDSYRFFKYGNKYHSYYEFLCKIKNKIKDSDKKTIPLFNDYCVEALLGLSVELGKGIRVEEALLLKILINAGTYSDFEKELFSEYGIKATPIMKKTMISILTAESYQNRYPSFIDKVNMLLDNDFKNSLDKYPDFKKYVMDLINFSLKRNEIKYTPRYKNTEFRLFEKYTRNDVCQILNYGKLIGSTLYGYQYNELTNTFPIFVNYDKDPTISEATKYEDRFLNIDTFFWNSRHNVHLKDKLMQILYNHDKNGVKVYLFVRKSSVSTTDKNLKDSDNDSSHYFLGEVIPLIDTMHEFKRNGISYVQVCFKLKVPLRQDIYDYLTSKV